MARHHPNDGLLIAYAAGSLDEPLALLVATHLALCPDCRSTVGGYEALGGVLLEDIEPNAMSDKALERVFERLDDPQTDVSDDDRNASEPPLSDGAVPQPLRSYLKAQLDTLPWRGLGGVSEVALLPGFEGYKTQLMRIRPGTAVPRHTHEGTEVTLVLQGGFSDALGHYARGDVAFADDSVTHQPVADPGEDCICLAVTDAPLRLTGPIGRLLNPFLRLQVEAVVQDFAARGPRVSRRSDLRQRPLLEADDRACIEAAARLLRQVGCRDEALRIELLDIARRLEAVVAEPSSQLDLA